MDRHFWMPGADRIGTDDSGGTLVIGPPRCTWHITYDKVVPRRPSFMAVMRYLSDKGYDPTIGWDPLTGKIVQFLPANRSARALKNARAGVETNRLGTVHVQIEAFFTPGMIVDGIKYDELTDTPMVNLDKILAWTDHLDIPRVWTTPRGSRSVTDWKTKAGHRAHYNVPENDHTDIAGADVKKLLMLDKPTSPTTGDIVLDGPTLKQLKDLVQAEIRTALGNSNSEEDSDKTHDSIADVRRDLRVLQGNIVDLAEQIANFQNPVVELPQPDPDKPL